MEHNKCTYHFYKKCRGGEGMWVLHAKKDHKDRFKFVKNDNKNDSNNSKPQSNTSNSDPSIQVRKELLSNDKAFLAARKDFQAGGTQD